MGDTARSTGTPVDVSVSHVGHPLNDMSVTTPIDGGIVYISDPLNRSGAPSSVTTPTDRAVALPQGPAPTMWPLPTKGSSTTSGATALQTVDGTTLPTPSAITPAGPVLHDPARTRTARVGSVRGRLARTRLVDA